MRPRPPRRLPAGKTLAALASVGLAAVAISACGSSTHASASTSASAVQQQQCTDVADVLSDGPDPNADPIGYAEAQVLPLAQLHIADPPLHRAVDRLDAAYKAYSTSNGLRAAQTVSIDEGTLLALCPKGEGEQVLPGQVLP